MKMIGVANGGQENRALQALVLTVGAALSMQSAAGATEWSLPPNSIVFAGENPAISLNFASGLFPSNVTVEALDSSNKVVDVALVNGGAASFNWNVPDLLPAGQYTLHFKGVDKDTATILESTSPKVTVQQKQRSCATSEPYVPQTLTSYSPLVISFKGDGNLITVPNPTVSYTWKDGNHQFGAGVFNMTTEFMACAPNGTLLASIKTLARDPLSCCENYVLPSTTPASFYRLRTNYTLVEESPKVRTTLSGVAVVSLKDQKCIIGAAPGAGGDSGNGDGGSTGASGGGGTGGGQKSSSDHGARISVLTSAILMVSGLSSVFAALK